MILAAPDIDADEFRNKIAPKLSAPENPITTLYASSKDNALRLAEYLYKYPRAGDSKQGLVVVRGIETIDATNVDTNLITLEVPGIETIDETNVDTNLLGHSYYAENRSIISDIFYTIRGLNADQRYLSKVKTESGCYWELKR